MDSRTALAKAIGALNIVADVDLDPKRDALRVTFMGGRVEYVDPEIGLGLAAHFELLRRLLAE